MCVNCPQPRPGSTRRLANPTQDTGKLVELAYLGSNTGTIPFRAPSGTVYRVAATQAYSRIQAKEQDVDWLLSTGRFATVTTGGQVQELVVETEDDLDTIPSMAEMAQPAELPTVAVAKQATTTKKTPAKKKA